MHWIFFSALRNCKVKCPVLVWGRETRTFCLTTSPHSHPRLYLLSHIPNFKQKFISTYNVFGVMKVSSIHHQSICTPPLRSEVWTPLNIISLSTTQPSPSGPHQTDSSCSFSKSCHFTKNYMHTILLSEIKKKSHVAETRNQNTMSHSWGEKELYPKHLSAYIDIKIYIVR